MKKVLYISYDGMTDPLGQSQVIPYLEGLSKVGYEITLLSTEKKDRFQQHKSHIYALLAKSNIKWETIKYHKKPPVVSTVLDVIALRRKAFSLHNQLGFDLVHSRSYISALIGLSLKRKEGVKFIFDMRGFWADERVDGNLWDLNNPLFKTVYSYFKKKEKSFLEEADATISLTDAGNREMHKWNISDQAKNNISIIPCCVDINLFDGTIEKQHIVRSEFGINKNAFVLTYLGSIGTWYMLDEMLDFFIELLNHQSKAVFFFIAPLDAHQQIINACAKKSIDKEKIILKEAQRNEVPKFLSVTDYSIFFIKPAYSKLSSSPTKQGELMAMGIPVICNSGVGDTDSIVSRFNSGLIVENFNKMGYEKVIQDIISDNNKFNSSSIRLGAEAYFSLKSGVTKYLKVYNQVLCETH